LRPPRSIEAGATVRIPATSQLARSLRPWSRSIPAECELHWHPNTDEWQYYIERQARTFDFRAGDVGFVPFAMGHYVENAGTTPMRFLEIFKSNDFVDVSLDQWMALTPPELVEAHLK
jgi:oxalate decarboxylase/phosphoglucose isomerase-like protein (cupin superfamily)